MHQSASASKKAFSLTETPYLAFKSFSSISFLWMVASRSCILKTLKVQTHVSILKEMSGSRVAAWLIISLFSGFSTYRLLGFCKLVMNIGQLGLQFAADFLQLLTSLTSNKYVLFIINQESKKINKQTNKQTNRQNEKQVVTKCKTLVSSNLVPRVLSYSSRTPGTRLAFNKVKWVVSSGNRSTEKLHGLWVVCAKKCVLNGKSYAASGNMVTWITGIK